MSAHRKASREFRVRKACDSRERREKYSNFKTDDTTTPLSYKIWANDLFTLSNEQTNLLPLDNVSSKESFIIQSFLPILYLFSVLRAIYEIMKYKIINC